MSRSRIRAAEGGQLVQRSAEDLSSRCFLTAVPISEPQLSCPSVTVIVAVVVVAVGAYFFYRDHAAVGDFAFHVLELDGGVVDVEASAQRSVDLLEDAGAFRGWNVGDSHVAR